MSTTMSARDFYLRVTDKAGKSIIHRHRVWDADRFLLSMQEQHAKDKESPSVVTVSNEAEFKAQQRK